MRRGICPIPTVRVHYCTRLHCHSTAESARIGTSCSLCRPAQCMRPRATNAPRAIWYAFSRITAALDASHRASAAALVLSN
eukprot:scaffold54475_cov69-Phaeocystis_antarctica.AAC.4